MTEQPQWAFSPDQRVNEELFGTGARIERLESRLAQLESHIPNTNLLSQKFWRRAFAVFGHQLCAVLAVYGVLIAVALVLGLIFGLLGALMARG